ncbi:hypothetical protein K439DRAFT_1649163 [Ramaria rubella]|nr:hypothetical protein K439DRAFT_1649163 [Ramaria rubella]
MPTLYMQYRPMDNWIPLHSLFLDELLCLEGLGTIPENLKYWHCEAFERPVLHRCLDCFGNKLYCKDCVVCLHAHCPLHRIQLGLWVQLGHDGHSCIRPKSSVKDFIVLDTTGIQSMSVDFCNCDCADPYYIQLLRSEWFPASVANPTTVVTFQCIELFQCATLQSKISTYDFYSTIEHLTDNTDINTPPDCYAEFMWMVCQWRHLKQLKHAGCGQIPDGIETTQEGELAVPCPVCPHLNINLPSDWVVKSHRSDDADPPLGDSWSYFVQLQKYKEHLAKFENQTEISTCSNFAAMGQANARHHKGLAITGVGACVCARHQLIRANGVGDLQRGERYCNMDYVFLSALKGEETVNDIVLSYDIACQWYKNLKARTAAMPPELRLDFESKWICYIVPKYHLPGHAFPCAGRMDGEGVERDWSQINPVVCSTKEMTPGHRTDTLNDHWGAWNWSKVTGMGRALARKIRAAVPERNKHFEFYRVMSDNLPSTYITEWTKMVQCWEEKMALKLLRDVHVANPYVMESKDVTQADVWLQLAQANAQQAATGGVTMHELQEHQQRIRDDRKHFGMGTSTQHAMLQERRNLLCWKIAAWETIQAIYMPHSVQMHTNHDRHLAGLSKQPPYSAEPEERTLFLRSEVLAHDGISGSMPLREIELALREVQAYDALQEIQHYLRLTTFLWSTKKKTVRGQKENTCSHTIIKRTKTYKQASVMRYHRAWKSLQSLSPDGHWSTKLKDLLDEDIHGLTETQEGETEGRWSVSWIWTVAAGGMGTGAEIDDEGLHACLRIEWCKACARAFRWSKEIHLVQEEMCRVLASLSWKSRWWNARVAKRGVSDELREGLEAYARDFERTWQAALGWVDEEIAIVEGRSKKKD